MEENRKNSQNYDYYSKTSAKVFDFIFGFLGTIAGIALFNMSPLNIFYFNLRPTDGYLSLMVAIIFIILALYFANTTLKKKRRYITKGINFAVIALILIPLLFFGACFLMISSIGL